MMFPDEPKPPWADPVARAACPRAPAPRRPDTLSESPAPPGRRATPRLGLRHAARRAPGEAVRPVFADCPEGPAR